jgi:hypothetical protein
MKPHSPVDTGRVFTQHRCMEETPPKGDDNETRSELDGYPSRKPFKVTPRPLGLPPRLSYDCIPTLLEELEGPEHR